MESKAHRESISKGNHLLQIIGVILIGFVLWIIWAGANGNVDFENYQAIFSTMSTYSLRSYGGIERGFAYGMQFFVHNGFSYSQYQMFFSFASILLLSMAIFRSGIHHPIFVLFMYSLFPFFFDVIQARNAIASALVVNGIVSLAKQKNLQFFIWIIVATLFHATSFFYLLLFLVQIGSKKTLTRIVIFGLVGEVLWTKVIGNVLMKFLPSGDKYVVYFGNTSFSNIFEYLVILILYFIVARSAWKFVENNPRCEHYRSFCNRIYYVSIVLFLLLPFLAMSDDFFRLIRNIFIMLPIVVVMATENQAFTRKKLALWVAMFSAYATVIYTFMLRGDAWSNVVVQVLKYNLFWR